MKPTIVSVILSLALAACASAAVPPAGPRSAPPGPDRASIAQLLAATRLLLDSSVSLRGEPIAGTRAQRRWLSLPVGDGAAYEGVVEALVDDLGPPTCSGATYAQWDGPIRIHAYRAHAYTTAVIIESPPDVDAACAVE